MPARWRSRLNACRRRLSETEEQTKAARRAAMDVPSLQAEGARLETRLSEAGLEVERAPHGRGAAQGPGDTAGPRERDRFAEFRRRRTTLAGGEGEVGEPQGGRQDAVARRPSALPGGEDTGRRRGPAPVAVRRGLLAASCSGGVQGRAGAVADPDGDASGGRRGAVEAAVRRGRSPAPRPEEGAAPEDPDRPAAHGRDGGETRLAGLRTARKTLSTSLSRMDAELSRALRRSRRQKAPIQSLSRETARRLTAVKGSRGRIERLDAPLAARGARPRPYPTARQDAHRSAPPAAGGVCLRTVGAALCADRRRGIPPRRVRGQGPQARDPPPAVAPDLRLRLAAHRRAGAPAPRRPANTLYGTCFWARFLCEPCTCLRPVHRVAAWLSGPGLAVSPGTLANRLKCVMPRCEPMADASLAHPPDEGSDRRDSAVHRDLHGAERTGGGFLRRVRDDRSGRADPQPASAAQRHVGARQGPRHGLSDTKRASN